MGSILVGELVTSAAAHGRRYLRAVPTGPNEPNAGPLRLAAPGIDDDRAGRQREAGKLGVVGADEIDCRAIPVRGLLTYVGLERLRLLAEFAEQLGEENGRATGQQIGAGFVRLAEDDDR